MTTDKQVVRMLLAKVDIPYGDLDMEELQDSNSEYAMQWSEGGTTSLLICGTPDEPMNVTFGFDQEGNLRAIGVSSTRTMLSYD